MREEVCAQTRGSGSLLERTSEKWGCKLSTRHREYRFSEETEKIACLRREKKRTIAACPG